MLLALVALIAAPAAIRPTLHGKLRFDAAMLDDLNAHRPDYVFIGNSMLGTWIDPAVLSRRLGADCCYVIWTGGAESAWEHQVLKNVVLAARHRPKRVFIFFRDYYLTRPTFRTDDAYWWKIERLSHDQEPALMRAMAAGRTWQEDLEYRLGLVYPVQKLRPAVKLSIDRLAARIAAPGESAHDGAPAERYNALFSLDRQRRVAGADDLGVGPGARRVFHFDADVGRSLLPSMLELAHAAGVQLVFVRVQRRPDPGGPPDQPPELARYIGRLRAYLAANGAGFHDFTGDPALTLERYNDGDHLRGDWRPEATALFLERLRAYIP